MKVLKKFVPTIFLLSLLLIESVLFKVQVKCKGSHVKFRYVRN